jgi:Alginate lyase
LPRFRIIAAGCKTYNFLTSMTRIAGIAGIIVVALTISVNAQTAQSNTNLIKIDFDAIAAKKRAISDKDTSLVRAYKQLIKLADKLLDYKPVSVMDKTQLPPSGDKHDYMSIAPYWWPDASKADGLPYIRKDGQTNPEVKNYADKNNMPKLCENVYFLALAYYFSDEEAYATHASLLLSTWFLDTATRMNPNLNFGQFIKGQNNGRGAGIIDTRHFIFVIDAIELIKTSRSWTKHKQSGMKKWMSDYLNWLATSDMGKDELDAKNNHGVWYDAQSLAMAIFIEDKAMTKTIINRAIGRLDTQMDKDGFFPLEMERTIALHYNNFILTAFNIIAQLSEKAGMNIWSLKTASGKSLKLGLQALQPYISMEKNWFGMQIKPFDYNNAISLFIRGNTKLGCKKCAEQLITIAGNQKVMYRLF